MKAALILVLVAATSRMNVTVTMSGVPLSVPVLGIVAFALGCALAAVLWLMARAVMRDGLRLAVAYNPSGGRAS